MYLLNHTVPIDIGSSLFFGQTKLFNNSRTWIPKRPKCQEISFDYTQELNRGKQHFSKADGMNLVGLRKDSLQRRY